MKNQHKKVKELSKCLQVIVNENINQLLTVYQIDEKRFGEATRLEALIGMLFLFDYTANALEIPQDFRQEFLEQNFNEIESEFQNKVNSNDPLKTIENRFNFYAEIPMHNEEEWYDKFITEFIGHLLSTQNKEAIENSYEIVIKETEEKQQFQEWQEKSFEQIKQVIIAIKKGKGGEKALEKSRKTFNKNPSSKDQGNISFFKRIMEKFWG